MEVLLFSLSISIDAFGYSLGFGSKNVSLSIFQFFILNIINTLILTLYLRIFSNFEYLFNNNIVSKISPILFAIFGTYYVVVAFYNLFVSFKRTKENKQSKKSLLDFSDFYKFKRRNIEGNKKIKERDVNKNYLNLTDLLVLFSVFIFENAFSTFVFYTTFSNALLFISTNFIFHFFFFLLGFNLGKKIAKKLNGHTSFISGYIFLFLSYMELFF